MQRLVLILLLTFFNYLNGALAVNRQVEAREAIKTIHDALIVGLGESIRVNVANNTRVHVSDGGVVRSRVVGRTVVMTGRRTGRATLRFIGPSVTDSDKTVFVVERRIATTARRFQERIAQGRGLNLDLTSLPSLIVNGELLRYEDWDALTSIARETKTAWRLEGRIFPKVKEPLKKRIENELVRLAWPGQRFSIDENGLTLTGGPESASTSAEQKLSVTTLGIQLETSNGLTELEPMIRTQIVIAEVRKNRLRTLGVAWPGIARAALIPTLQIPTSELLVDLQAMEQEGEGRILAMPTLLCRSGGEAKFMAGGEVPIKLTSARTAQIEWKKYGIQLQVQPKADRMKRMKFQLSTEISTLDEATAIDGVKGMLVNRIETQFNLNGPETIVLSGLLKREEGSSSSGLPLLKSIPILGSLFQSEDFKKHLTELIIFVSPEVIIPDGNTTHE